MLYDDAEIEKARRIFSGECKFIAAALNSNAIPSEEGNEVAFAGREGSNHPHRSNARRVMEYGDAVYNILDQITAEIIATREDIVKPVEEYSQHIPMPSGIPDHQNRA